MLLLCMIVILTACSPRFNWRELDVADGHVRAAFPDRVYTETRQVSLGGHTLAFSLSSAQVGAAVFAIGYAPWPESLAQDPAARRALAQALQRSLYANLNVPAPDDLAAFGDDIEVHGQSAQGPGWLLARVWADDSMLIEAVAAGSIESLPAERAREFLRSVVIKP